MVEEFLTCLFRDYAGIAVTGRISSNRRIDIQDFWEWPSQSDDLVAWVDKNKDEDLYISPMLYSRRQRSKEAVAHTPVLWVDCDTADPADYALPPSIVLETSPGKYQGFWMLEGAVSPQWAEAMSKKITYSAADKGSDRGGWGLTKFMRIPGATNTKYAEPFVVTYTNDGRVFSVEELDKAFGAATVPVLLGIDQPIPDELPDRAKILAMLPPDPAIARAINDEPKARSWSETLWWLECELFRHGLSAAEVFAIVRNAACNKYKREGRPELDLWKEVLRAQQQSFEGPIDPGETNEVSDVPVSLLTDEERLRIPRTFVDDYVEWAATRTTGSIAYQECAALTILSTVLSEFGHAVPIFGDLPLHLWFMLVGVTTRTYKTTAKNLMLEVLRPIQTEDYDYDIGSDASPEGLLVELQQHPKRSVLFHRDEAHGMLGDAKGGKSYMSGFGELLTELYDGWARGRLRSTGKEKRMPPQQIKFNMFLLGVPEKLSEVLTKDDFASGFMPRFIFAIGNPDTIERASRLEQARTDRRHRLDTKLVALQEKIVKMRAYWHRETSPGETIAIEVEDDAWDRFNEFILTLNQMAEDSDHQDAMRPGADRMNKTVLKVACLFAMSEYKDRVSMEHMYAAIAYAERWYATLNTITRMVGRTEFSSQVESLVRYVQSRGGRVRMAQARRFYKTLEPRRWNDLLSAAREQQLLQVVKDNAATYLMEWE